MRKGGVNNDLSVHSFANGQWVVQDGKTYNVEAVRDEPDGDYKTAMVFGYKGIKQGEKAVMHEVWANCYGWWARIEYGGRKFDVRPESLRVLGQIE